MEGIAVCLNDLTADAYCYRQDGNGSYSTDSNFNGDERVSIYDPEYSVDLDVDSDNNGYINNPANNRGRAQEEDKMEGSTPKPITYNSALGVPAEYAYVDISVNYEVSDANDIFFSFSYTRNLEVYAGSELIERKHLYPFSDLVRQHDYKIKATGNSMDTGFGNGVDKVHLILWKYDSTTSIFEEVARDTVCFKVQDNTKVPGWVIPSGWTINSDGSFTTPIPGAGAIGPKTEGSGIEEYSGDAYYELSDEQKNNGFHLSFDFSFVRNTTEGFPTGYLRPDCGSGPSSARGDEQYTSADKLKMSFFGNSGVKFFGEEVQIFDTVAFCNAFNIKSNDINNDGIVVAQTDRCFNTYCEDIRDGNYDRVSNYISGAFYKGGSDQHSYSNLKYAYDSCVLSDTQHMSISVVVSDNKYKITVSVNGENVFGENEISYLEVTKSSNLSNKIFLQSHWGSGVTFANVSITNVEETHNE